MVKIARSLAPVALGAALVPAPLAAGTASGAMTVTATVEESCHLDARPLVFGTMPGDRGRIDASSSVVVDCTPATSYAVTIDDGRHGADGVRRMADAAGLNFLPYELYSDAARSRRWDAGADRAVSAVAPARGRVELPVYARVEAGHAVAGAYGDVVTVTVVF